MTELRNTQQAIRYGQTMTAEQHSACLAERAELVQKVSVLNAKAAQSHDMALLQVALILAFRAQLLREASEAFTGTGSVATWLAQV